MSMQVRSAWPRLRALTGDAGLFPLLVLLGLASVMEFDFQAFGVLGPEIRHSFHLSNSEFVTLASATGVAPLFLASFLGYVGDRRNRVWIMRVAAVLWAVTAVFTGLAPVIGVLIAARLVGGIGRLTSQVVQPSLLTDFYAPEALPTIFAISLISVTGTPLLSGPLAGGIAAVAGWRAAFILLALPTLLFVVVMARLGEPARGASIGIRQEQESFATLGEEFRRLAAIRSLRRTWVAATFFGGGVVAFLSIQSLYFKDVFHEGPAFRGAVYGIYGVAGLVGIAIGGYLSQRAVRTLEQRKLPVINGLMVVEFGAFMILMAVAPNVWVGVVATALLGIGAGGYLPAYNSMVGMVTSPRVRTQAFAWSFLWVALGAVIISPVIGGIGDGAGQRAALWILAALVIAAGLVETTASRYVDRDVAEARKQQEAADSDAMLVVRGLDVAYGNVQVLFGVDIEIRQNEVVALLGTNGAGKSTLLGAISGTIDPVGGAIYLDGRDITHADAVTKAKLGIVQVPGGRGVFPTLTVRENLQIAAWMTRRDRAEVARRTDEVLAYFPVLREMLDVPGGNLSGGQQQMLTLAQALLAKPRLLMIDELSLGLAPVIVEQLLGTLRQLAAAGTTIVLVEQSVNVALTVAQRAFFMEKGEVRFTGPTAELLERGDVLRSVFLEGAASVDRPRAVARTRSRARTARERVAADAAPVLQVDGLTKSFGGVTAVHDVGFTLMPHQILGIIGPNGAGKTTLFDLISGYVAADTGRITLDGDDITSLSADARARRGLGRSFQDARLFPGLTVAETIALALDAELAVRDPVAAMVGLPVVDDAERAVTERVDELIETMALQAFRDKFVSELSTGSRRIVDLACIMARDPKVILFDEPSSGIAQREAEALGPLLRRVRESSGAALLVIEHDMPLISGVSDEILALDLGRVVTRGAPDVTLNDPRVVAAYLGTTEEVIARSGSVPVPRRAGGARRRSKSQPAEPVGSQRKRGST